MGVYLVLNSVLSCRYDVIKPAVGSLEVKRTFYIGSEMLITPASPGNGAMLERKVCESISACSDTTKKTRISHAA